MAKTKKPAKKAPAKVKPTQLPVTAKADMVLMKEAKFVDIYLANGGNGAAAYVGAGFKAKNGEVAATLASRLFRKDRVSELLATRRSEILAASKLTADEALQSLARAIRFDPRKMFKPDGSLKGVHELDADTADALAGFEVVEMAGGMKVGGGGSGDGDGAAVQHVPMFTKKVKWLDKNAAREQAMKHFGHYEADNRQKPAPAVAVGVLTVNLNIEKSRERARVVNR